MRLSLFLLFVLLHNFCFAQVPTGFTQTPIAGNLNSTNIKIADDGRVFLTEKHGLVRIIKNNVILSEPLISIAVDNFGERGLENIVLDPDFGNNQYFYLYYTVPGMSHNRVSRFKASGDYADPNSELVLIDLDNLPSEVHNGGGMVFGRDGKLYIATGDGYGFDVAQNLNSLLGKILRINPDGSIPEDNPFYNIVQDKNRSIYALGLRNPFSMSISKSGLTLIEDVGNATFEEINVLEAGKNYGWPITEGNLQPNQIAPTNYKDPLYAYPHDANYCAIVGGAFYSPSTYVFPEKYRDKFFFADYCANNIRVLDPQTGVVIETFISSYYRPISLLTSADGSLYILSRGGIGGGSQEDNSSSSTGSISKFSYTGNGKPFIYRQPLSQTVSVDEFINFNIAVGGAVPLTFKWFKNGIEIENSKNDTLKIDHVSLAENGAIFTCQVANSEGFVTSTEAILNVTSNNRPTLTILLPDNDYKYRAGDTIRFKGIASDLEDGILTAELLSWKIDFHHNDHVHPALSEITGIDSSSFIVPLFGETSANVWYRIYFSALDSEGFGKTLYKDIFPVKSTITLGTDPAGLTLNLDGQPVITPLIFDGVVNLSRSLYAPPVLKDETNLYTFNRWSGDIFTNTIELKTPDSDSTFTAFYTTIPLADGSGLKAEFFNQDKTFNPPANYTRVDSSINFDWNIESPEPGYVAENNFTALWTGYLKVPEEDNYTFTLLSDDGSRLWINDLLIVDNTNAVAGIEKTGSLVMIPDKYYRIRVEYFDVYALASIKLFWSSSAIPKSIVPKNQLFLLNPDNTSPLISFTYPNEDFKFISNSNIVLRATANDLEDGTMDPKTFRWRVNLNHDGHVHSILPESLGLDSLSFIAKLDEINETNLFYTVYVSTTDKDGSIVEISKNIYPSIVNLAISSNIEAGSINLGEKIFTAPDTIQLISGTKLPISAHQEITIDTVRYGFVKWSFEIINDSLTVPLTDFSLTAVYSSVPSLTFLENTRFSFGDTIKLVANAIDLEDGVINPKKIHWRIDMIDQDITYSLVGDSTGVDSITFPATQLNKKISPDLRYRISISVNDSDGLASEVVKEIFPSLSETTFVSNINGIVLSINGQEVETPIRRTHIVGSSYTITAPLTIIQGDTQYSFLKWSQNIYGGILTVTSSNNTVSAIYNAVPIIKMAAPAQKFSNEKNFSIRAIASDVEDGQIDPKKIKWSVEFFDQGEKQLIIEDSNIDSLTFQPNVNSNSFEEVWYRIRASITDSDSTSASVSQDIYPNLVDVGLTSNLVDIPFKWNNEIIPSTSIFKRIQGTHHLVSVPGEIRIENTSYVFGEWLNYASSDTILSVQLVNSATILTAIYKIVTEVNSIEEKVMVYPNPFSKNITIKWGEAASGNVTYDIVDVMGKHVLSIESESRSNDLDLSDLSMGIYFLIIQSKDAIQYLKIAKIE